MIVPRGPRHVAAALFLLIAAVKLAALPADRAISQYVRRAWTVEQGLPHGTVRGVAQTGDGYLWIATYEGLVRFNGEHFRILDRATNPELLSNSIITLCRTPDDTLWLGTASGLVRYRQGVFQTISLPGGPTLVNALTTGSDGSVWVGTLSGGLIHVASGRIEAVPLPPPSTPITALAPARDGGVWIGTSRGLARFHAGEVESWSTDTIVSLLADGDDTLYIGTAAGLDRFQNGSIVHIGGLPNDQVTAMHRDRDGNLWLGTYASGVIRMSGDRVSAYGIGDGLLNPTIRSIFEDDEGSIWIGSNGGIEQLRGGAFITWNERYGLTDDFARAIFQDRDGVLWAGSAKGLSRFDGSAWTKAGEPKIARILAIAQSRDGAYWFGTSNGVYRVDKGKTTLFTTAQGLSNNTVRDVHEDRRGNIWIATDFGLNRITPDGKVESFAGRDGLTNDYAMQIAETPDGRLWIATGGGLAEYDGAKFKLHAAPGELPSNHLLALTAGNDGTVWITTDADGLIRYRNGKARVITTREGLAADKNLSIASDGKGNLWLGTVRGAFRASEAELNAIAEGRSTHLTPLLFDENDGLGSRQCNGAANPSVLRTRDGRIWFVTANGVSATANNVAAPAPLRMPVIERVMIDGKTKDTKSLVRVPPGAERIEFEFSGLTFVTPERLRFRYRLEGYDDNWFDAGTNRVASYTNLPAGDYHFILESSRDGVTWKTASLPLGLQPHFYETRWFIALCVLAVLGLFGAIHSIRLHFSHERARLLEKLVEERTHQISEEKERTEVALRAAEAAKREAERHERLTEEALAQAEEANRAKSIFLAATSHELRTPLNAIIGFSDILISHIAGKLDERYSRFLQNIHDSGQYLLGIINNILDLSKVEAGKMDLQPETILLREVVVGISAVMKGVTTLRKITIETDIPDDLPYIEADQTLVKQILYNLMSNAVKFSPERSTVTISARHLVTPHWTGDGAVEIRVTDRGIGIDAKDHELIFQEFRQAHGSRGRPEGTGLGLALVKRFVEMHSGTIAVESERGRGSTFIVILPCRYTPAIEEEPMAVGQGAGLQHRRPARLRHPRLPGRDAWSEEEVLMSS